MPHHGPDTLWVNNGTEPETIDPGLCSESAGAELAQNLFAGLIDTDPATLRPVADLAERWTVDAAQTTYTFVLRKSGWSDGARVTAEDFAYSWLRVLDPNTASRTASLLFGIKGAQAYNEAWLYAPDAQAMGSQAPQVVRQAAQDRLAQGHIAVHTVQGMPGLFVAVTSDAHPERLGDMRAALVATPLVVAGHSIALRPVSPADVDVRAPDANTLIVGLERPVPYFLQLLAHTALRPVPRHTLAQMHARGLPEALWTRPEHIVTNGAYTLARWRFRRDIDLTRNPHYWDAEHVALTHIKVLELENAQTALNLYRTGDLDWLGANTALPSAYLETLRRYADFHQDPLLSIYFYWFNARVKPLDDVRVRQALSLAIDRRALVERVLKGGQTPTASLVPDGVSGYRALDLPLTDVKRAQALLREAGYVTGAQVPPITLSYHTAESHKQIAETLQAMWSEHLGINVTLENAEWRVFLQRIQAKEFAVARMGWIGDYPDANTFLHDVLSQASANNLSGIHNAAFERTLHMANQTPAGDGRLALLRQAEALAMADQPLMPLFVSSYATLVKPYVQGYTPNFLNRHPYRFLSIRAQNACDTGTASAAEAPR